MKIFTVYRRSVPAETHNADQANPPDQPQFEGVIFSDGKTVIHWLTSSQSISVFDSFEAMDRIHGDKGHPNYKTEIVYYP